MDRVSNIYINNSVHPNIAIGYIFCCKHIYTVLDPKQNLEDKVVVVDSQRTHINLYPILKAIYNLEYICIHIYTFLCSKSYFQGTFHSSDIHSCKFSR